MRGNRTEKAPCMPPCCWGRAPDLREQGEQRASRAREEKITQYGLCFALPPAMPSIAARSLGSPPAVDPPPTPHASPGAVRIPSTARLLGRPRASDPRPRHTEACNYRPRVASEATILLSYGPSREAHMAHPAIQRNSTFRFLFQHA